MRKVLPLSVLALTALLFFTGGLVARDNRAQPVATNPDVICGPEVCAQLVPYRVRMGSEAPPERGS